MKNLKEEIQNEEKSQTEEKSISNTKSSKLENIPELNIGVVGHIDHGKTTILNKLTDKKTDTHSEELKRGITIKLGYADMTIYDCEGNYSQKEIKGKKCVPKRYISFIDAPGHEMLMATMLSGAAIIDAAILVIAANEGIKPQTKEHFMALQAKGIKNIIIVQNKIDLISEKKALENYKKIREFLKGSIAENCPIIPVSAQQGINIEKVLEEIVNLPIPQRDKKSEPLFIIARSFDINKPGSEIRNLKGGVLGGILKKGELEVGDEIEIKPGISVKKGNTLSHNTLTTKILSLYEGNQSLKKVSSGPSISIETSLDPFITKTDSLTGCVCSKRGNLPDIKNNVKLKFKLFSEIIGADEHKKIEPIKTKEMLMLSVNTTITVGVIEKINEKSEEIELNLNIPIVALKGDQVGIARNIKGHWRLIGFGEIV